MLSAIYILWMYQRMMTGPVPDDLADGNDRLRDLVPREIVVVAPLIALLLVLGRVPQARARRDQPRGHAHPDHDRSA